MRWGTGVREGLIESPICPTTLLQWIALSSKTGTNRMHPHKVRTVAAFLQSEFDMLCELQHTRKDVKFGRKALGASLHVCGGGGGGGLKLLIHLE